MLCSYFGSCWLISLSGFRRIFLKIVQRLEEGWSVKEEKKDPIRNGTIALPL